MLLPPTPTSPMMYGCYQSSHVNLLRATTRPETGDHSTSVRTARYRSSAAVGIALAALDEAATLVSGTCRRRCTLPKIVRADARSSTAGACSRPNPSTRTRSSSTTPASSSPTSRATSARTNICDQGCIWVFRVNRRWSPRRQRRRQRRPLHQPLVHAQLLQRRRRRDKTIRIRAAKRIEPGDELTYDYNTEGDKTIPCRCRPGCKTKL